MSNYHVSLGAKENMCMSQSVNALTGHAVAYPLSFHVKGTVTRRWHRSGFFCNRTLATKTHERTTEDMRLFNAEINGTQA
jgi:hypothetical protein